MQEINPIDYPELTQDSNDAQAPLILRQDPWELIGDVEVELSAQVGTMRLTVAQLNALKCGQVITLEQLTTDPILVKLNGKTIACAELMLNRDNFALKITQLNVKE